MEILHRPMLSYQHEYHAGNHGDVLKHALLVAVLEALRRKPKPLRVIDAYAGSGTYRLDTPEARRTNEHRAGIGRLLGARVPPGPVAEALAPYLAAVRAENGTGPLLVYPGSPRIVQGLLRPEDHLELLELHPQSLTKLRRNLGADPRVHIHGRDAAEGLPAILPPPERRGLVLIDPAYEVKEEYEGIRDLLVTCHRRWPGGTYLVWYPLIRHPAAARFAARIATTGIRRIWQAEVQVEANDHKGMRGSGVLLVNPPFGVEPVLKVLVPWLWQALASGGAGHARADWLVPE